jgi:hypothetical protein
MARSQWLLSAQLSLSDEYTEREVWIIIRAQGRHARWLDSALSGHPVVKYHDTDVGFLCPLPLPVFLEEDKGPDHDVLAASGVGGRGRVDGAVTDEWIAIFKQLWSQSPASFDGRFYQYTDIRCEPFPSTGRHTAPAGMRQPRVARHWTLRPHLRSRLICKSASIPINEIPINEIPINETSELDALGSSRSWL